MADKLLERKNQINGGWRMKEIKTPKKPMIIYVLIAVLVLMIFNTIISPMLFGQKVEEIPYNQFLDMIESNQVKQAEIQDQQVIFIDKQNPPNYYKTGKVEDNTTISERLYNAGVIFDSPIIEQASPIISFLFSWILPFVLIFAFGQLLMRSLTKKMGGGMGNAMSFGKSNAKIYVQSTTGIKFSDVAGEDEAKESSPQEEILMNSPKTKKGSFCVPKMLD